MRLRGNPNCRFCLAKGPSVCYTSLLAEEAMHLRLTGVLQQIRVQAPIGIKPNRFGGSPLSAVAACVLRRGTSIC